VKILLCSIPAPPTDPVLPSPSVSNRRLYNYFLDGPQVLILKLYESKSIPHAADFFFRTPTNVHISLVVLFKSLPPIGKTTTNERKER
ncbi:unnamed protein product, partial [Amoebophrya sp. A120]